jgi:hypothetical protein
MDSLQRCKKHEFTTLSIGIMFAGHNHIRHRKRCNVLFFGIYMLLWPNSTQMIFVQDIHFKYLA